MLVLERHVPLADDLRGVAVLLELAREARLARPQEDVLLVLAGEDDLEAVQEGVSPREQLRARGRAKRVGETMREPHPFLGEPVQVGRLMGSPAIAGKALHPQVVGQDEQDVGFFRRQLGGGERGRRPEQQGGEQAGGGFQHDDHGSIIGSHQGISKNGPACWVWQRPTGTAGLTSRLSCLR